MNLEQAVTLSKRIVATSTERGDKLQAKVVPAHREDRQTEGGYVVRMTAKGGDVYHVMRHDWTEDDGMDGIRRLY